MQIIRATNRLIQLKPMFMMDKMLYLSKNNDAFIVKVADELEDAIRLIEIGFEFHTEIAGHKVFRKRK